MLLLNRDDIGKVFGMKEAIKACKQAFLLLFTGDCILPHRIIFSIRDHMATNLYMPCTPDSCDFFTLKGVGFCEVFQLRG